MDKTMNDLQRCLELQNKGGGVVHITFEGEMDTLLLAFDEDWIKFSSEHLSTITLNLPTFGCLSLLHPQILEWEVERHDFNTMEESE